MNCSRQSGTSTTTAILALHTALYQDDSLIPLLSPGQRQSVELFRKCLALYRELGRSVAPEAESALWLELENGSRIVSAPGKEGTIRGFSDVRLLVIDEEARAATDLCASARPMLAVSGGRLITLSTPFGTRSGPRVLAGRGCAQQDHRSGDQRKHQEQPEAAQVGHPPESILALPAAPTPHLLVPAVEGCHIRGMVTCSTQDPVADGLRLG